MKKALILLIIVILLSFFNKLSGQRYIPGLSGIDATYSLVDGIDTKNYNAGLHFSTYTKNLGRWIVGFDYLNKMYPYENMKIPLRQITAEGGYYFKIISDRRKIFFFSIGITGLAGYEIINGGKKMLPDGATILHEDKFIYGGTIGCELETYITDKIIILLNVKEKGAFGSTVSKFHMLMGGGLKFIIN